MHRQDKARHTGKRGLTPIRSTFTGSLGGKRKHELVEIAEALNISDPEAKMAELKDKIQAYLDSNETTLSKTPQFKGLYGKKRLLVDLVLRMDNILA